METVVVVLALCLAAVTVLFGLLTPLLLWRVLRHEMECRQLRQDLDKADAVLADVCAWREAVIEEGYQPVLRNGQAPGRPHGEVRR